MMSQFIKVTISCPTNLFEILIAELSEIGFDSFQEKENELEGFVGEAILDKNKLQDILKKYSLEDTDNTEIVPNVNWNEEWEKNFDPIEIDSRVQIRASFHEQKSDYEYDIVINPKMSFGTGHHATTYLIIKEQLSIDHNGMKVLDVGTGTGILSIFASKLGAASIVATDIDDWCIQNCRENFKLNNTQNFEIYKGTLNNLTLANDFDLVIANINKNVLLGELPTYVDKIKAGGLLIISGFYSDDNKDLLDLAKQNKLNPVRVKNHNNWSMMVLSKDLT